MKHFIYVDSGMMASYYAQAYGGLTTQKQQIVSDTTSNTTSDGQINHGSEMEGKLGAVFASMQGKIFAQINGPMATFSESQLGQEIVTSTMHDNIFDQIVEHAKSASLINNINPGVNDYVHIEIPLHLADLKALVNVYASEDGGKFIKTSLETKFIASCEPKNSRMTDEAWEKEKHKLARASVDKEFVPLSMNIQFISSVLRLLPLGAFFYGENGLKQMIIPTKECMFKEPLGFVSSFMEGTISVFGRVTKVGIERHQSELLSQLSEPINAITDRLMHLICDMPIGENTLFILPMAIYS